MATLITPSSTKSFWVLGHEVRPLQTVGDFAMLRITTDPGVPGPPPHHHEDVAEFFLILDGQLEIMSDGDWTMLSAGDSCCVPTGTVHTFRNPTDRPCEWLTAFCPRDFEKFFQDFGVASEEPNSRERSTSPEVIERIIRDAAAYRMVLMPPA